MCNKPRGWLKIQAEIRRYYKGKSSNPTLSSPSVHLSSHPPSVSLTPIQPSDYPFEQTAYLRRFPHSRGASI